jgi:hypothetical protein
MSHNQGAFGADFVAQNLSLHGRPFASCGGLFLPISATHPVHSSWPTHSPILLAYPNSTIYSCDGKELKTINYKDTKHYEITKDFLNNPEQYLKHLFED